jgi:hypothetical protein
MNAHTNIDAHDIAWAGRAIDAPITERVSVEALFAEESSTPLAPNKADISRHLYALFSPAFVQAHPDAWIEIAYANPATGGDPDKARNFSAFNLEAAVKFAVAQNNAGLNVYVGAALRHGDQPGGRSSGHHVLTASHAWGEFDKPGDEVRITAALKEKNLTPAMVVTTGTVPNLRAHLYFRLDSGATPDQLRAANTALKALLGTDAVQNPDRLMRLAGTVNYPSPDKMGRGYAAELVTLRLVSDAPSYTVEQLTGVVPPRGPGNGESEESPAPTKENFFKNVNQLALVNASRWVRALFGNNVRFYVSTGCWRTQSNKDLPGRAHLEEAIQISQRGVWDYGEEKPSSPIDLVMAFAPKKPNTILEITELDAAEWLCWKMGVPKEALGWGTMEGRSADDPEYAEGYTTAEQPAAASAIHATPYVWANPASIPQRQWLYGKLLLRKFVSATVSPGGVGKSSLVTAEALAMVSGKELLGIEPRHQLRVWLWNLEDPQEETARKIQATALHYDLEPDDIGDRLLVNSGREQRLVIATTTRNGTTIVQPVVESLVAEIIKYKVDVLVVDPFVSCHEAPENDNSAMDMIIKEWGRVADRGNCAVHLIDHTRKMGGTETEVTVETSRGAKSKTDGCRVVRAINRMTEQQAAAAGVDNHRFYFRTYNDKANLQPPADNSDWFKLESVDLGNGSLGPGFPGGDSVGVVTTWDWPDPLAGVTGADFEKAAYAIRSGKWREHPQAKYWVGNAVANALGLSLQSKKDRARVTGMIKVWIATGALVVVDGEDEKRMPRKFVEMKQED